MIDTRSMIVGVLAATAAVLGYLYYQSRQNVVEIKLPSVTVQPR